MPPKTTQKQKKQEAFIPPAEVQDEMLAQVNKQYASSEITFDKQTYQLRYHDTFTKEVAKQVFTSDSALESYYEQTNPEMLEGLQSKSFFNFPGKKKERKKLRQNLIKKNKAFVENEERNYIELYSQEAAKIQENTMLKGKEMNIRLNEIKAPYKKVRDEKLGVVEKQIMEKVHAELEERKKNGVKINANTPNALHFKYEKEFKAEIDQIKKEYEEQLAPHQEQMDAIDSKFREADLMQQAYISLHYTGQYKTGDTVERRLTEEKYQEEKREKRFSDYANIDAYYKVYEPEKYDYIKYRTEKMDSVQLAKFAKLVAEKKKKAEESRLQSKDFMLLRFYHEYYAEKVLHQDMGGPDGIRESLNMYTHLTEAKLKESVKEFDDQYHLTELLNSTEDTEEVRQAKDAYAKMFSTENTYRSIDILRKTEKRVENIKLPDIVLNELKKKHPKYNDGDFERTCKRFMKPVKYIEKDGKKICASKQDEENLAFNNQWAKSLLSNKEKDWEFRFKEMENFIDKTTKELFENIGISNLLDENYMYEHLEELFGYADRILILSGINEHAEQNNFFRSGYYKSLPQERQKELSNKVEILTFYSGVLKQQMMVCGANVDTKKPMAGDYKEKMEKVMTELVTIFKDMVSGAGLGNK